jgi:uncharacterized protein YycO
LLSVALLSGTAFLAMPAASVPASHIAAPLDLFSFAQARDGDLIFRAGRDMVSQIIMAQNDGARFSHVGVIFRRNDKVMVVHALPSEGGSPGGVVLEPLSIFASADNASRIALYRIPGLRQADTTRISGYALSQVGKPFDDEFSMTDGSRMYCAELAVKAYAAAGQVITPVDELVTIMTVPEPVVLPDALSRVASLQVTASIQ